MSDTKPLTERLEIKAMMIQMGERIAYGSDSGIMREAVAAIKNLQAERDALLDRVEKAEKDAERYRLHREVGGQIWHLSGTRTRATGEYFDFATDEILAKQLEESK